MSILKPVSVWIVDDDEDDQYLFKIAFQRLISTVEVTLLDDGEDLLPALNTSRNLPTLIILDLNMPRLNGFEALTQLRADKRYSNVPVIVLTTSSNRDDQQRATELGAHGFLTKPPSMDLLLVLFGQLVEDWRLKQ